MGKSIYLILVMLACGIAASADVDYVRVDPVVEVRGVWIDAGAIPKTDRGIREMVRGYARTNFNVLIPETICRGYAIYPSRLIERDPRFAGSIDPLPVMIDEAHKLGMEVHPWVWVFRVGYTRDKGAILRAHPNWAERGNDGKELSPNGGYWVSPANPGARDYLACLFAELVSNYDVDGLHLDYIRYETEEKTPYGFAPESVALFERQYGVDPARVEAGTLDQIFWNKFRERQISTFVQRIALQTRAIRPRAMISAAVAPYPPDARLFYMQNWPNWVENKWIDFVAPMSYSTDDGYFGRLIFRHKEAVDDRTILAEGIGLIVHKDVAQTVAQIGITRQKGAFGQVLFAASYLGSKQLDALRCGPYATRVGLPFRCAETASVQLCSRSQRLRAGGLVDLADYYSTAGVALGEYAAFRKCKTPYAVPTAPPIAISH